MRHIHLFEFEDQDWIPDLFRNMVREITHFNMDFFRIYDITVPKIEQLLQTTGKSQIIDLCSGASGPWVRLVDRIESPVKVILTDKYPALKKWKEIEAITWGKVGYNETPVDTRAVPVELKGLRTIFTGFHHFKPGDARKILEDAVADGEPIAIFEFTERSFLAVIRAVWLYLLLPFLQTPFIKPRHPARFFWTYLVPVVPIMHWWDGLISHLRTYSPKDLHELVKGIDSQSYQWEIGFESFKTYGMKARISYLIGYKSKAS